jgi:hypothetical protein
VKVRCADCRHKVSPAISWRNVVFPGWVQCRLALSEDEGKARYLSPGFARVCAVFAEISA